VKCTRNGVLKNAWSIKELKGKLCVEYKIRRDNNEKSRAGKNITIGYMLLIFSSNSCRVQRQ
jgi:hypothetical protein